VETHRSLQYCCPSASTLGRIVLIPQHAAQALSADSAEFHLPVRQALGRLPDRRILQRPLCHSINHAQGLIGFLHFPQDVTRPGAQVARPSW
jgi:hypothetical protein